jgi:DNA-binding response OmpR family regulator
MPGVRVLVVEDDDDLLCAVVRRLRANGFAVDEAEDGAAADVAVWVNAYDCIVLDRRLPTGDGLELLIGWRRRGLTTPVLFLTALDRVLDRVDGFSAGGDDYLVKPFAMDELVARVDTARHEVHRGGVLLPLTVKERCVLELLAVRAGTVVTRSELIEHCWDEHLDPVSNVVDVHLSSLRRKLGDPPLVRTVRGSGFLLELPA